MDTWVGARSSVSTQYVHTLSKMINDEPSVFGMISIVQGCCLRQGIFVQWGATPATPSFQVPPPVDSPHAAHDTRCGMPTSRSTISPSAGLPTPLLKPPQL